MPSPLKKTTARANRRGRKVAAWAGLAVGVILPTVGCQVEYAGMTLPSGKYMHDDVQYFPPGPDFPWANTQAATQRARMQAMGLDVAPPPALSNNGPASMPPPAQGALPPGNVNQAGGVPNVNQAGINQPGAGNVPAVGGAAPGGNVPGNAPNAPGGNPGNAPGNGPVNVPPPPGGDMPDAPK